MESNALGMLTLGAGTSNTDGVIAPEPAGGVLPYTVANDGTLSVIGGARHEQDRARSRLDDRLRDRTEDEVV